MDELTKNFKYVFMDVVKYTQRSIEAQVDVIDTLNKIVKDSFKDMGAKVKKDSDDLDDLVDFFLKEMGIKEVIYIPTGDGICIAMSGESKYDIHMIVALDILDRIHSYNQTQDNHMRKFDVRIGINENVDNVIEDINGRRNVAGSGINLASRIMDNADGGQILVSQSVYDILHAREQYMDSFKTYSATIKHGIKIPLHQYIKKGHSGLNTNTPSNFSSEKPTYSLDKKSAYYFAHAIKNRELVVKLSKKSMGEYILTILLWFRAEDSSEMSTVKDFDHRIIKQPGGIELSFEEQYEKISSTDAWILIGLCHYISSNLIKFHRESFEVRKPGFTCHYIINEDGQQKLKKEHPDIWQEFNLDDYVE